VSRIRFLPAGAARPLLLPLFALRPLVVLAPPVLGAARLFRRLARREQFRRHQAAPEPDREQQQRDSISDRGRTGELSG
jgi:hypothetical protein